MKKLIYALLLAMVLSTNGFSRDFVVIKNKQCQFHTGLIIGTDEQNVTLLDFNGKTTSIKEDDISTIITYGTKASPLTINANTSKDIIPYLKRIELRNSEDIIEGFAFHFIEDLVFINNLNGKIIVLSKTEISSIEDLTEAKLEVQKSPLITPDYSEQAIECGLSRNSGLGKIPAVRVLGDNLKIAEYLSNYKMGERKFRDLQERTVFYSKPYLFPRRSRMGITQVPTYKTAMPFYYQWSTGEDFHFQSVNRFGGALSPYLPNFEISNIFASEFKSHFLHGYFEGNLLGLSSGTIPVDFESNKPKENVIINNFNYFAFMGADWRQFSLSYGGGYFTPVLQMTKHEYRELSANSLSSAVRFAYTAETFSLQAIAYLIDDKSSSSFDIDDQLNIESKNSISESSITGYTFKANYYRIASKLYLPDDITLGGDLLIGAGEYNEKGSKSFDVNFDSKAYLVSLMRQFGHYVTLTLYMKNEAYNMESKIDSSSEDFESDLTTYGGRFELLF